MEPKSPAVWASAGFLGTCPQIEAGYEAGVVGGRTLPLGGPAMAAPYHRVGAQPCLCSGDGRGRGFQFSGLMAVSRMCT